jgi:hypothetical protein
MTALPVATDLEEADCPIFIVGCPRSGTSALWAALQRHPRLGSQGSLEKEIWFFIEFFEGRAQHPKYRVNALDRVFVAEAAQFVNRFVSRHCGASSGRYVTAHPNNVFYLDELCQYLPGAKFIMLVRDPVATVWSLLNAPFAVEAGWRKAADVVTPDDVLANVERWKHANRVIMQFEQSERSQRAITVRHENLLTDADAEVDRLWRFLGEEPCREAVDSLKNKVFNSSFLPQPLFSRDNAERLAFFERQNIAAHQSEIVVKTVHDQCRQEMEYFGYLGRTAAPSGNSSPTVVANKWRPDEGDDRSIEIIEAGLMDQRRRPADHFLPGDEAVLGVTVRAHREIQNVSVSFRVVAAEGNHVFGTTTFDERYRLPSLQAGRQITVLFQFAVQVRPGRYQVDLAVNTVSRRDYADNQRHDYIANAVGMNVLSSESRPVHYLFHNPVVISTAPAQISMGGRT